MTVGDMIKVLRRGILEGSYSSDDELTIATSSNGLNMDGQISIDSVASDITSGLGPYLKGPIIEVKGRVRDCGEIDSWGNPAAQLRLQGIWRKK